MKDIKLKHIVGYLPFGLILKDMKRQIALTTTGAYFNANKDESFKFMLLNGWGIIDSKECKPILRPLSDLTKEIEIDGKKFTPNKVLHWNNEGREIFFIYPETTSYSDIQQLYEWHFDVHGLIKSDLAIDINTL